MKYDIINGHPLTNEATTSIRREDLIVFLKSTGHEPRILAVSEGAEISRNGIDCGEIWCCPKVQSPSRGNQFAGLISNPARAVTTAAF